MKRIYICFPEGRYKALTLSYDDGKITDRRLTEIFRAADIRATFHLNSAYLGSSAGHRIHNILPHSNTCYPVQQGRGGNL